MSLEISPLDGRYRERVGHLGSYFSEFALMSARVRVELDYAEALERTGLWKSLSVEERARIERLRRDFGEKEFRRIKELEGQTRHDLKACELFLREALSLREPNRIHFGITSEDVNNLAYSALFREFVQRELLPQVKKLVAGLCDRAQLWADAPFPTRTHGQRATPSTAGKELAVFVSRLTRHGKVLASFRFAGKMNGATGTYGAMVAASPGFDWVSFCEGFVRELGFEPNPITTQIEDHDRWAELFDLVRRLANVVLDLDRDLWSYLSLGWFQETAEGGQVGSSTMPHKVNPIHFENSEGNLELAVAMLSAMGDKLTRSRMQRDLSDSTVTRNVGVALSHVWMALDETIRGLARIELNQARCLADLEDGPEVLAEPIQSILRVSGVSEDPYELLRSFTRGRRVSREDLMELVGTLPLDEELGRRISDLRARHYVGAAPDLCRRAIETARREFLGVDP
ncbi:MAG: adenylosuccinate lyase [Deltaproteobacteria bacterium]|nr:adenylosuccinate lyase [Deltaproteobacteria bacterium]